MKPLRVPALSVLIVSITGKCRAGTDTYNEIGGVSCGAWTSERKIDSFLAKGFEYWVVGFISGVNWSTAGNLGGGTDNPGLYAFIDNYCAPHPLDDLGQAVGALIVELRKTGQ